MIKDNTCQLCSRESDLQDSHIIPKFVFKWLKRTSATGYLRSTDIPNRRDQDGFKRKLLCRDCEQIFSTWETEVSELFRDMHHDSSKHITYGQSFLNFLVSVSWRSLLFMMTDKEGVSHFPSHLRSAAYHAKDHWNNFLLDQTPNPGSFEQHVIPLDRIESHNIPNLSPYVNRYLLRSVDLDLVCSDTEAFVYSKMCRMLLIGFIEIKQKNLWKGTKVHLQSGSFNNKDITVPDSLLFYINDRIKRIKRDFDNMSLKQQEVINDSCEADLYRVSNSETFQALNQDVMLFGDDAFDSK